MPAAPAKFLRHVGVSSLPPCQATATCRAELVCRLKPGPAIRTGFGQSLSELGATTRTKAIIRAYFSTAAGAGPRRLRRAAGPRLGCSGAELTYGFLNLSVQIPCYGLPRLDRGHIC